MYGAKRGQFKEEAEKINQKNMLFADDTTIVSQPDKLDEAKETTKKVMGLFEERKNESK